MFMRGWKLILLALLIWGIYSWLWPKGIDLHGKNVAIIVAPMRFKDSELRDVNNVLTSLGAKTEIFSIQPVCIGVDGWKIRCKNIDELNSSDFDALVLIGGPGALTYYDNNKVHNIVRSFYNAGRVIGAICLAPGILAEAGILRGKKATVWWVPEFDIGYRALIHGGAEYVNMPVVVDGKIVTANGPQAAKEFTEKLAEVLARG